MERFKVLLVYPNLQMMGLIPSNIALLAACLKKAGIGVKVFDTTYYRITEKSTEQIRIEHMQVRPFNLKDKGVDYKKTDLFNDFKAVVDEYRPDIIGISCTDDTYELGLDLISRIDTRERRIHVIVGGIYPTFSPEEAISAKNVDSICIGEGEESLIELCDKMRGQEDITAIKNLWVKKNGRIYKNGLRTLVNIDNLPYDDFSVFEKQRFFRPMQGQIFRMIPICTSRGCPYGCTFCAADSIRKLYVHSQAGQYFRVKSTKKIIDELRVQIKRYGINYVFFNSETFLARQEKDIEDFADQYARHIGLPFWCETRVETITRKRIKLLKYMNCNRISIGIEHGNEAFRKNILKKNFTNQQAIKAFKIVNEHKIPISVNNMIGFPDETRELAFDTIRLNRALHTDSISAFFFVPYRGTSLRQYCIEKGYLDPYAKSDTPYKSSVLNMPHFTPEEIKGLVRTFSFYIKMPESYYSRIKIAEQLNEEGDAAFTELREAYLKKYF